MAGDDDIDWNDLRYFLRAVQSGTLAGAARAMGVDHSTVGRRLTALERVLGAPVVIRGADGLHLTSLGESLMPLAEEVERGVLGLYGRATQRVARVRLAMPTGFTKLFSENLARLRAAYPQLTSEFVTGARVVDLKKGEADLAVRSGPVQDQDLIARSASRAGRSTLHKPTSRDIRPQLTSMT